MPGFIVNDVGSGVSSNIIANTTYNWEVQNLFGASLPSSSNSTILLKDCTLPTFNVSKQTVRGASIDYKFAEKIEWQDCSVNFYDAHVVGSDSISELMKQWRETIWDDEHGIKFGSTYKKDSKLRVFVPFDKKTVWHLYGSWPSSIKEGELTYTSSDIKTVSVSITYDWAKSDPSKNFSESQSQ